MAIAFSWIKVSKILMENVGAVKKTNIIQQAIVYVVTLSPMMAIIITVIGVQAEIIVAVIVYTWT